MAATRISVKSFDDLTLISITQATKRYRCSRSHIEREIKKGNIDSYRPANKRWIDQESADAWFLSKKEKPVFRKGNRKR
ncbi:MerR family transcriptional regulator [Desulforhopalus singaporensis]|uniref:Helix-turn-helix domain-containing protein n=1 Tax=Desulforhopalus singaporensis TaxID=91360 RepID=A0A1H0NRC3_9BACT|nr:hypothetical protein [Desulforhopalus singaporensis]SDO95126.1 hypothetical protein SAMN05660330_01410 [Desulforhopalus singaporensis]